jgi:DNA polymerase alpha subunit B
MNNRIQHLAHEIAAENGLDATEFTGVSVPSQTGVLTYGRIISDSMDGRLNAASVMLEGDDSLSHGYRVRLDLTEVESFALFPGQVCVIEGHNVTGQVLVVQKIYTNARLPAASSTTAEMQQQRPLTIMYAAGPFHLCPPAPAAPTSIAEAAQPSTLDIVPLVDLIVHAKRCTPDVLILSGPFIDAEADIVARVGTTENFCLRSDRDEELLSDILSYVQSQLSGTKTNVHTLLFVRMSSTGFVTI